MPTPRRLSAVRCPNCETEIETDADVEFAEIDATTGVIRASKRYYTASCATCNESLGGGVAGAKSNPTAGGAGGH